MSYMMRDRPDGQFEIVLEKPILLGIFPERDTAEQFMVFLQSTNDDDLVEEEASSFTRAAKDVKDAQAEPLDEIVEAFASTNDTPISPKTWRGTKVQALPKVMDRPRPPAFRVEKTNLTSEQTDTAFSRISKGEKIADVAPDFGVTMGQLRGLWASHCRKLQKHLAEGGQIACLNCTKPFTPSISHPETCARCSK